VLLYYIEPDPQAQYWHRLSALGPSVARIGRSWRPSILWGRSSFDVATERCHRGQSPWSWNTSEFANRATGEVRVRIASSWPH